MPEPVFNQLADLLPEAMLLVRADGVIVAANRAAGDCCGLAPAAIVSRPLPELTADSAATVTDYLRACARSRELVLGALTIRGEGGDVACRCEGAVFRPRAGEAPAEVIIRLLPRDATVGKFQALNTRIDELSAEVRRRQRAEDEARDRQQWLRITLASIGDAVIATDMVGRVSFMNPVAEALTGWSQAEAAGRPLDEIFIIVNERSRRPAENPAARALREGTVIGLANHTLLVARDGRETPIDDSAAPIKNERGEVGGVVLVFRDVAERRRAEHAKAHLAAIVESSDDAIISKDRRGMIVSWNRAAERLYGYSAAEALGRHISLIVPPDHVAELAGIMSRLWAGERVEHFETVRARKDGVRLNISLTISPVRDEDGEIVGASKVARDITADKRRARALQFLADASDVLSSLVDTASTLQKVARVAVPHFADWCAVDLLGPGGNLSRVAVAHADPAKVKLAGELHERFPPDPASPHGVWRVIRERRPEWLPHIPDEVLTATVKDADLLRVLRELGLRSYLGVPLAVRGEVVGAITFATAESGWRYGPDDVRVAEEVARRAGAALENARLYQELRETDRRKDEFLATLAHELRNPLAPIRNGLEILRTARPGPEHAETVHAMMSRQLTHLVRLVDDLMDVSRISRGKVTLLNEPLELAAVIRSAVETSRPLLDAARHTLSVDVPDSGLCVRGDLVRLAQLFANLLNNAAKYTPEGGFIGVSATREDMTAVVRVRDNGMGIPPEKLARVFDLFAQVENTAKRSHGGLGIGLTLVRRLAELHGGGVEAHSRGHGKGSEFVVRLPLLPDEDCRGRNCTGSTPQGAPAAARRILVVDDNVDAAETLAAVLRLGGDDVRTAHAGPAALTEAVAFAPDVFVLDLGMPAMDGFEVARRLRADARFRAAVLIALTGWGSEEDRRRTREAGFDHHLVKPVDPGVIHQLLDEVRRRAD